ncbi:MULTISPECIES: MarR family winged helix-turn-helix transcriptional regulator [Streptomyces]|jgi:DNA-binding MarR family transcriptional regulator|uniref:MarR family transcriptional regulator n=3 Tax=Streptomyces albogriseolus group TaxID=2867120 RepID=A0ABP6TKZ1_9ACTN|nr:MULTISPECIES: MarR family winged helix-turn-helix transcriptional regulator [Streptomyces]MCX4570311.1 MarR family winged helix-turn-helix transcriptional regulator [Streptomyces viridodiastaticus]MCX4623650.1 MarR family winged helix-turn-helix transcriptional regulator [Streptomyces viridodiastaticus]GHB99615.1 MarR family transcriptional regulator [Streptomyces albogriseolus]
MSTNRKEDEVRWLTAEEEQAWRAFRRMVIAVQTRTVQDLAAHGLSEPDYEVLSTLSERPEGTSTLHEQAAKMGWSRSRLSRHATRMEARDLIRRAPDPADGRGCLLVLTETGWDTLRQAAPTHLDSVRRHFVDRLEPEELAALGRIAEKIADEQ